MRGRGRATAHQNSFMDGKTLIGPAVLPLCLSGQPTGQLCNLSHFTLPGIFYYIEGREQIGLSSLNYMEVDNNMKGVSMNTEGIYYLYPGLSQRKTEKLQNKRFFLLFSDD